MVTEKCPICSRELGEIKISKHHLVPKSRGGKIVSLMHDICHNKLHNTFTNKELETIYCDVEKLREHEQIQKFIKWVAKKPLDFYSGSDEAAGRRRKRR